MSRSDTVVASSIEPLAPVAGASPEGRTRWTAWLKRGMLSLLFLPVLLQVLAILRLIWRHTSRVPFMDEWETVQMLATVHTQGVTHVDFLAFHNEHRILFTRIIDLIIIELTHYNRQVEMSFDLAVGIAAAVLLVLAVRRSMTSRVGAAIAGAAVAALMLSLGQYEEWIFPFQIQDILTDLGVAVCVWVLTAERISWRRLGAAALAAAIATLSSMGGLIAWPAFLPLMWRAGRRKFVAWIVLSVGAWALYFIGFPPEAHRTYHIRAVVDYLMAYLGAPIGYPSLSESQLAGALSIVLLLANIAAYWLLNRDIRSILVWIGLALFALGNGAIITAGRIMLGVGQALQSRYQAFSLLWWVALVVLVCINAEQVVPILRARALEPYLLRVAPHAIVGISVVALLAASVRFVDVNRAGYADAIGWQAKLIANQGCVAQYATAPEGCLRIYYPDPQIIRTSAPILQQEHFGIFFR